MFATEKYSAVFVGLLMLQYQNILFVSAQGVCEKDGVLYNIGDIIKENCNQCTCVQIDPVRYQFRCTDDICLVQPRLINAVNRGRYGWTASNYSQFWGKSLVEGTRLKLGTFSPDYPVAKMTPIQVHNKIQLPSSFDAREKWGKLIHPPLDQKNCGASWAFSTIGVASDRVAIETDGNLADMLSPQHLLSCSHGNRGGCNGGHVDEAWHFLRRKGVLTDHCYLYTSGDTGTSGQCFVGRTKAHPIDLCPISIRMVIHTTPAYRIPDQETDIMAEIMKNGPVQALMRVKEDFFVYKSGVYRYSNIQPDNMASEVRNGYHSVRIIGWGEESSGSGEILKYWICINSWGKEWGENGYFRIERRNSHCKIESFVIATHLSKLELEEIPEEYRDWEPLAILGQPEAPDVIKRGYYSMLGVSQDLVVKKMNKTVRVVIKRRRKKKPL